MSEAEFDDQMLALFDSLRVESDEFRKEFREGLRQSTNWELGSARKRGDELRKRQSEIVIQQDRLLNLRLLEEINADTYVEKATLLRDEETHLSLEIERQTRERYEIAGKFKFHCPADWPWICASTLQFERTDLATPPLGRGRVN